MNNTDHSRVLNGVVVAFNENNWWGEVCYDLTVLKFHGTSYRGLTSDKLPEIGQKVNIILNRAGNLLVVEERK